MYSEHIEEEYLKAVDQKIRSQAAMNGLFFLLLILEVALLLLFLPFFMKNAFVALMLAAIILTLFSYGMIKQYLDVKKKAFFDHLLEKITSGYFLELPTTLSNTERHIAVSGLFCRLADRLYQKEYHYYLLPNFFRLFRPFTEKMSCLLHWQEIHQLREQLLQASIKEYVKLVKTEPTSRDAHALLANAYVMLSGLYADPKLASSEESDAWIPPGKYNNAFKVKFQGVAQKAIEEFKILHEYAPKDPWVHMQLAYSYRDLNMPKEEKMAYESILAICPHDNDTRFKLGTLCFQQGEVAKGLKIYEELKKVQYNKADELLLCYGENRK